MSYLRPITVCYTIGRNSNREVGMMFSFLALGTGVLLAIMIQINGTLSGQYGTYHAALYIHIIGACAAALLLLLRHKPIRAKSKVSFWMLTGGVIGVGTTVFNNLAFSHISLTCIVALQLFAELLISCLIDAFGLFGMQRRGRGEWSIAGLLLSVAGIALMLDSTAAGAWIYVLMSMGAGVTVVLSRTVNAHLSDRIGALPGTLVNHLAGMPVCLLLMLLLPETGAGGAFRLWTWCGGLLGVAVVASLNVVVPRLPASRLTLLSLCGQLLCGVALDLLVGKTFEIRQFGAALLVGLGILVSQLTKIYREKKALRAGKTVN